jgi:hypothetical protein
MMNVQPMTELIALMRAVARGEIAAPADAAEPSVESVEALDDLCHDTGATGRC